MLKELKNGSSAEIDMFKDTTQPLLKERFLFVSISALELQRCSAKGQGLAPSLGRERMVGLDYLTGTPNFIS